MIGMIIFDRFGFNLPKNVIAKRGNHLLVDFKEWGFLNESADWVEK
jgi:hypothetical protein